MNSAETGTENTNRPASPTEYLRGRAPIENEKYRTLQVIDRRARRASFGPDAEYSPYLRYMSFDHHIVLYPKFGGQRIPSFIKSSGPAVADRLVVFVHGFAGNAIGSWADFEKFTDTSPFLQDSDIYFYAYRSIAANLYESARDFREFIGMVWPRPSLAAESDSRIGAHKFRAVFNKELDPLVERSEGYRELVLCGHSEGAVVVRQALVNLKQDRRSGAGEITSARVVLFASAQGGVNLSGLKGLLAGGGADKLPLIERLLRSSGAYNDLSGSTQVLSELNSQTTHFASEAGGHESSPFTSINVWADNDDVVSPLNYLHDTSIDAPSGTGHSSVSKPQLDGYRLPVDLVEGLM